MRYSGILFLLDFNSHSLILIPPMIITWSLKLEGIALTKIFSLGVFEGIKTWLIHHPWKWVGSDYPSLDRFQDSEDSVSSLKGGLLRSQLKSPPRTFSPSLEKNFLIWSCIKGSFRSQWQYTFITAYSVLKILVLSPNKPLSELSIGYDSISWRPSILLTPMARPCFYSEKGSLNHKYFLKQFFRWSRSFSDVAWVSWSKINRGWQLAAILQQRLSFSSLWTPLMFHDKILMFGNLLYWYRFGNSSAGKGGRKEDEGGWDTKTGAWGVGEARFVFGQKLITEESEETQGSFSGGKKDFKLLLFFFPFILSFMRGGKKRRMKHCLTQGIEYYPSSTLFHPILFGANLQEPWNCLRQGSLKKDKSLFPSQEHQWGHSYHGYFPLFFPFHLSLLLFPLSLSPLPYFSFSSSLLASWLQVMVWSQKKLVPSPQLSLSTLLSFSIWISALISVPRPPNR